MSRVLGRGHDPHFTPWGIQGRLGGTHWTQYVLVGALPPQGFSRSQGRGGAADAWGRRGGAGCWRDTSASEDTWIDTSN